MLLIVVFGEGGTFCKHNFLLGKLFDYHLSDILVSIHQIACRQQFAFPFKCLPETFLIMAPETKFTSPQPSPFLPFSPHKSRHKPQTVGIRDLLASKFDCWMEIGAFWRGFNQGRERCLRLFLPWPLLLAPPGSRSPSAFSTQLCGQTNRPMCWPSEVQGVGK